MKPLTPNQIALIDKVKEKHISKKTKKSQVIVQLIDDYQKGKNQTKDELQAIKLAVQLYQVELKNENLRRKERQIQTKERSKENKDLTREKIILGSCTTHLAKEQLGSPFLEFLRAWSKGFLSDRDLEFMKTRYNLKSGNLNSGEPYWLVNLGTYTYRVYKTNKNDKGREYLYQIFESKDGSWTKLYGVWII